MSSRLNLDQGNSNIHWLILPDSIASNPASAGLAERAERANRGIAANFTELVKQIEATGAGQDLAEIKLSCLGSPQAREEFSRQIQDTWGQAPKLAEVRDKQCGLTLAYSDLSQLGVDRWLAMLAVLQFMAPRLKHPATAPWLIIGAGTAITMDLLVDKTQLGGIIIPNSQLMQDGFYAKTGLSQSSSASPASPASPDAGKEWGDDTATCLQFGTEQAVFFLVLGKLRRFFADFPEGKAVISGGGGEKLLQALNQEQEFDTAKLCYQSHLVCLGLEFA